MLSPTGDLFIVVVWTCNRPGWMFKPSAARYCRGLGGEVVKGEERVAILDQALDRTFRDHPRTTNVTVQKVLARAPCTIDPKRTLHETRPDHFQCASLTRYDASSEPGA